MCSQQLKTGNDINSTYAMKKKAVADCEGPDNLRNLLSVFVLTGLRKHEIFQRIKTNWKDLCMLCTQKTYILSRWANIHTDISPKIQWQRKASCAWQRKALRCAVCFCYGHILTHTHTPARISLSPSFSLSLSLWRVTEPGWACAISG